MPYDSRTYRILIASPSDVEDERELAVRVIQEWNDLYSYTRKIVLLPLRWETHTAPEYGTRPQEVINRAIVDSCDLLVGVFWTRIGTPTGSADSGTLEEIERVAKAGKPVMLYFSNVPMDPDKIDLAQLGHLQTFKQKTYPNALTESFKSQVEFRDKFAKQLELKVRELQKADHSDQPPPLRLEFFSPERKCLVGPSLAQNIDLPELTDLDAVLSGEAVDVRQKIQKEIEERVRNYSMAVVLLAIENTGSSGIRNVYVEMSIRADARTEISDSSRRNIWVSYFPDEPDDVQGDQLQQVDGRWEFRFEWDALQPQRTRLIKPRLLIRPYGPTQIEFTAKVFADSFSEPITLKSQLILAVTPKSCVVADIVDDLDRLRASAAKDDKFTVALAEGVNAGLRGTKIH
jgi:hypothetical protein